MYNYTDDMLEHLDAEAAAGRGQWIVVYPMVAVGTPQVPSMAEVPPVGPRGPFKSRAEAEASVVPYPAGVTIDFVSTTSSPSPR